MSNINIKLEIPKYVKNYLHGVSQYKQIKVEDVALEYINYGLQFENQLKLALYRGLVDDKNAYLHIKELERHNNFENELNYTQSYRHMKLILLDYHKKDKNNFKNS